jgi:hypothetical protein
MSWNLNAQFTWSLDFLAPWRPGIKVPRIQGTDCSWWHGLLVARNRGTEPNWLTGFMGNGSQGTTVDRYPGANSTTDQGRADIFSCPQDLVATDEECGAMGEGG